MGSAFDHSPSITVPSSSTNTGIVTWSGTGANTFLDSTVLVVGNSITIPGTITFGGTQITSTAAELNLLDGVSGLVQGDFTKLAAVDATAAELNLLNGVSGLVQADLTKLAAIDATAAEINKLDGASANVTAANLNALTGSGATALHSHSGGGPSQASDTEIENRTNVDKYVPPDLLHRHPGVAKVWIRFYQSNSSHTMGASYGVASIADGGAAGFSDFTWSTAFSSAEYAILVSAEAASVSGMEAGSKAAGTVTVRFWDMNGTYNDALHASVACFGDL